MQEMDIFVLTARLDRRTNVITKTTIALLRWSGFAVVAISAVMVNKKRDIPRQARVSARVLPRSLNLTRNTHGNARRNTETERSTAL